MSGDWDFYEASMEPTNSFNWEPPLFQRKGTAMGRPKGSRNKAHEEGNGDDVPLRVNSANGEELMDFITRIESINAEQKQLSADRSQVYVELKTAGYSRDTVREIVRRRKMTLEQRQEQAATLDMYLAAIGDLADTPLGRAGAARIQEQQADAAA